MLRIATDLKLPLDFASEKSAILARTGLGKTYTASVLAEELADAGQPFVVLDPVGVWWGLRSRADGKPGLKVTILGADHGDVPLEPTAGALIATFIVDNPGAYVIDLSAFDTKGEHDRFVADFAQRLYKYKAAPERRTPLTLIIDEADEFAPQRILSKEGGYVTRMLGALETIVRRGRARGLGCVMITQRPAALNNNVLMQAGALILLGMTGPADRKAIDDWVSGHATDEERKQVIGSLAGLDVGEAWVWWPAQKLLRKVQIRPRRTFDSSSTPKVGEARPEVRFAAVDLDALKDAVAESIERAQADDPKTLHARIRDLQKQVRDLEAATPEPIVERVEVDVISDDTIIELQAIATRVDIAMAELRNALAEVASVASIAQPQGTTSRTPSQTNQPPKSAKPQASPPRPRDTPADTNGALGKGETKVLAVLAQYPDGRTYNEVAFLAGYSAKASTLGVILSKLRKLELVEPGNQPVRATAAGIDAAGGVQPLPSGPELLEHWLRHPRMGEGERKVLLALIDAYPDDLTHHELCDRTGYSPDASTIGVILSKLRKLGLVEKGARRAMPEFMESIT